MKKIASFIFICLLVACQANEKVDTIDKVEKKFSSGKPEIVTQYIQTGDTLTPYSRIQYHQNGEILMTGKLDENGNKDGLWKSYYSSGKPWSEGGFKNGVDHGIRIVYFENGQKRYEGQFDNGEKSGKWVFWDENGELLDEMNFDK